MRLSNMKDEELVRLIKEGNEQAWETLENRHRGFLIAVCNQFFLPGADFGDRISYVLLGLLDAVRDYDPSTGTPFKYWAQRIIHRHAVTAIKTYNRTKHAMLNNAAPVMTFHPDGEIDESRDIVAPRSDPFYTCYENQLKESLWKSIEELLSPFEADVLVYLRQGMSYSQIAQVLQTGGKSVDNAIARIKEKARRNRSCRLTAQDLMETM